MFRPVKGPLWAQAYQKNMRAYADLGPDIFSGQHANFVLESFLAQLEWARRMLACWAPTKLSAEYITKINLHYTKNSIVFITAFGSIINVVLEQNKFQPYNKRPVGIKFIVLQDKSTIICIEAHII